MRRRKEKKTKIRKRKKKRRRRRRRRRKKKKKRKKRKVSCTGRRKMLKFVCAMLAYTVVTSYSAATQGSGAGCISGNERAATM